MSKLHQNNNPTYQNNNPTHILNAFTRHLQYGEMPENTDVHTLWKTAYEILLKFANNKCYANYKDKLSGIVEPGDIVQDVIEQALKKVKNKHHEPEIFLNYKKNIAQKWNEHYTKHYNKKKGGSIKNNLNVPLKQDTIALEQDAINREILGDCMARSSVGNDLGYEAFKVKTLYNLENEDIEKRLGRPATEIASAYFEYLCDVNICLEYEEAIHRCWLQLKELDPHLFLTEALYKMEYKPRKIYEILVLSQQAVAKRRARSKKLIDQCVQDTSL